MTVLKKTNFTINQWHSRVLQKLLKYYNGIIILTFFVLPPAAVLSVISTLDLIDSEFSNLSFCSSL